MKTKKFLGLLALLCAAAVPAAGGKKAPPFTLPGITGPVELAAYRGRVVYLDFWASWCGPCRKSFPWMSELQARHPRALKVIAVNLDENREDAMAFVRKLNPRFTIAFDPEGRLAEAYGVQGMPSSYLIDANGNIVASHVGFRESTAAEVEAEIARLIGSAPGR
ncbi:MAG: thiol:disulfide interchange protein [Gammaproteobacteria bacterium]|nr:MAG: thiol:disulfide interchange protein [Gammaproteobacteria bacterium]